MRDEDETKIRQLLIAAPLDYQPTVSNTVQQKPEKPLTSHVA